MDYYLAQHPEIFMAPAKESHYFAPDISTPEERWSEDKYFSMFAEARDELYVGESSVFYMMSEAAAERIRAFCPEARILIFLRNPIDFIESHHSQIVYEGLEDITDLGAALAAEPARFAAEQGRTCYYREKVRYYRRFASFSEQIERFLDKFGPQQVHFAFYEDLRDNTPGEYRKILEFLGVNPTFRPNFALLNGNKQLRNPSLMQFLRDPPKWATISSRIALPHPAARRAAVELLKRMNTKFLPRAPMSRELRERLTTEMAPEVARLERMLGRDLRAWRGA